MNYIKDRLRSRKKTRDFKRGLMKKDKIIEELKGKIDSEKKNRENRMFNRKTGARSLIQRKIILKTRRVNL